MKRGKSAQSEIITTVLIILLVLAAIVIVWNVVKKTVVTGTEKIDISKLITNLEIQEVNLWVTGGAEVKVKRGPGSGKIDKLKFIFEKNDGTTTILETTEIPKELETKTYPFNLTTYPELSGITKVSLTPILNNQIGLETKEPESKIQTDDSGNRIYQDPEPSSVNLMGWWKFDETSGTIATDSAGTNLGTLNGGAYFNDGELILDGVGDYVEIAHSSELDITGAGTWAAWVYLKSGSKYQSIISKTEGNGVYNNPYDFRTNNSAIPALIFVRAPEDEGMGFPVHEWVGSADAFSLNAWHSVAITVNSLGNSVFYIDGNPSGGGTFTINPTGNTNPVLIGRRGDGLFFNGSIDNVMIFNKALTPAEVKALYNNQK